jgi:hypothetical protein
MLFIYIIAISIVLNIVLVAVCKAQRAKIKKFEASEKAYKSLLRRMECEHYDALSIMEKESIVNSQRVSLLSEKELVRLDKKRVKKFASSCKRRAA